MRARLVEEGSVCRRLIDGPRFLGALGGSCILELGSSFDGDTVVQDFQTLRA